MSHRIDRFEVFVISEGDDELQVYGSEDEAAKHVETWNELAVVYGLPMRVFTPRIAILLPLEDPSGPSIAGPAAVPA